MRLRVRIQETSKTIVARAKRNGCRFCGIPRRYTSISLFGGQVVITDGYRLRTQVAINARAKQGRIFESPMDWPNMDCPTVQLVPHRVLFVRNPFFQPAL